MFDEVKVVMNNYMRILKRKYKLSSNEVIFSSMIIKKTIDILDVLEYVTKKNIITVQISLIRLLCDNALAIEACNYLSLDEYMNLIYQNQKPSDVMIDEENNLSDGMLKRRVAEKYPGFAKVYNFASSGVHLSKQALSGIIKDDGERQELEVVVGNANLKDEIKMNNNSVNTLVKVIIDMLRKLCNI